MRAAVICCLALGPVVAAAGSPAANLPEGAVAYVELNDLADSVDQILDSPLGVSLAEHPIVQQFLQSEEGRRLQFFEGLLRGGTGEGLRGTLRLIAAEEIAVAAYPGDGDDSHLLVAAHPDSETMEKLLSAVELFGKLQRTEELPAREPWSPMWSYAGETFFFHDGDLWIASTDRELAVQVRDSPRVSLADDRRIRTARGWLSGERLGFAFLDRSVLEDRLGIEPKAKDLGAALLTGSARTYLNEAEWVAVGLDIAGTAESLRFEVEPVVPAARLPESVSDTYGGTLSSLPFDLGDRTLAAARGHRDLAALWNHRDALIEESGIPGLVEIETNFSVISGGINFVEELLPNLGDELAILATRRELDDGAPEPAAVYPQAALVVPLREEENLGPRLEVAFQTFVGVMNAQNAQEGKKPLVLGSETYRDISIQTARYLPPSEGEMDGRKTLPVRYNLAPATAIVGEYFVIGSTHEIVRDLIDVHGRTSPAASRVNSGIWVEGEELALLLEQNREPLIARRMIDEGGGREQAERAVDLLLHGARYLETLSWVQIENKKYVGMKALMTFGSAGD